MKKILKFLIVFAVFLLLPVSAKADEKVINIHLFYGNGCPHCAAGAPNPYSVQRLKSLLDQKV